MRTLKLSNIRGNIYKNAEGNMTTEQKRIKILEKRIRPLAEYLETFHGKDQTKTPSLEDFLKRKGITREMFIKDLPPELQSIPAIGYNNAYKYATALHKTLQDLHNIVGMQDLSADGNDLGSGLIKYEPGQYIRTNCGCGCDGQGDDKDYSGSGGEQEPDSAYLQYQLGGGMPTEKNQSFAASGLPKICIHPIAPLLSEKLAPGQWRAYRNKVAEYDQCRRDKNAGATGGKNKIIRATNVSNPALIPVRASLLKVVAYNIFGLAQVMDRMRNDPDKTSWNKLNDLWYNWGGDESKLNSNVSIGYKKKPVFRPKGWQPKSADGGAYLNSEAATLAYIGLAQTVLTSFIPVINQYKKSKGEGDLNLDDTSIPEEEVPYDPNAENGGGGGSGVGAGMFDNINWYIAAPVGIALLIGIGFGIYKLTK